jgi:hypothetical protein
MALTEQEVERIREIAELETRRYFDHYLESVFPEQVERFIDAHNECPEAHGGVEKKVNRTFWMLAGGVGVLSAGAGFGLKALIAAIVG